MNERITILRKYLRLTMEEFGEKVGVTRAAISNIESGKRNLTDQMILSICREFDANEEWLRYGTGDMLIPTPTDSLDALAMKYDLSHKDYIFIQYLLSNSDARKAMEDFCIGYANAVLGNSASKKLPPAADVNVDSEMEDYRRTLEEQKKAAGTGSLSSGQKDA